MTDKQTVFPLDGELPYFQVETIKAQTGMPRISLDKKKVNTLLMMSSADEWTDPQTGHLWVNDETTKTLVEEGDSRVSWYRGVPYRKVEPGDRYQGPGTTERQQAREKGEKARRLGNADEEWFQSVLYKYSSMVSQLAMKYLGEYDRTDPGMESDVTRVEKKIARAFTETSPLKAKVKELEKETTRVRQVEVQVDGLLKRYWSVLGDLDGASFTVQFDALEPR